MRSNIYKCESNLEKVEDGVKSIHCYRVYKNVQDLTEQLLCNSCEDQENCQFLKYLEINLK